MVRAGLACLTLAVHGWVSGAAPAWAQSMTPDFLSPTRGGFLSPQDSPLRRTALSPPEQPGSSLSSGVRLRPTEDASGPAPSRIGQIPSYDVPPATGAADTGYDSLNRARKKPKYYPGQAQPKPPPGPGSPPPTPPQRNAVGDLRLSIPPSDSAHKAPVAPAMAGTVDGQPARKRLRVDDDPFGAVGDYAGGFLIKSAVELSGAYETNPGRTYQPHGLPSVVIAPEFLAVSDWERHALVADLRGSFTGYGGSLPALIDGQINSSPTNIDRPNFIGHVDGRLDVSHDLRLTAQTRLLVSTDNPGSPNVQAGLAEFPIYTTLGGTFGFDQSFNRLDVAAGATIDRTSYAQSRLTDGSTSSNEDRNFNQYGGIGRVSYELTPALRPFVEAEGDSRVHDLYLDSSGFARDSTGGYAKAGTSFEFSRLLIGELSIGWVSRTYADPRLDKLQGLLTTASLTWNATPLTTAKFYSDTQIGETTLPGSSGVFVHTYTVEVDHDFRRWLTAIGKFTFGTLDYQGGDNRTDKTYTAEGDLIYKMTRNLWIKGTLRYDALESNIPLASSNSTLVMLGVRVQN